MDERSFRTFYEQTRLPLRAYLYRATNDADLADDLTQEAYVRLLGSGVTIDDATGLRRYLFRIASNLMHDHWRRQKWVGAFSNDVAENVSDEERDPMAGHDLEAALAGLNARQRSMMWLAYVEGYSHREIADALKLKEGSIKVLLHRARQRLRDFLMGPGSNEEQR